jgi:hypothetical protein
VASLSEPSRNEPVKELVRCLACGKPVEVALSLAGSLRCMECRDVNAALDARLVEHSKDEGARF